MVLRLMLGSLATDCLAMVSVLRLMLGSYGLSGNGVGDEVNNKERSLR